MANQDTHGTDDARMVNLAGTFALLLTDRMFQTASDVMDQGHMTAAALIQIGQYSGDSIDALRHRLGLSHSAVVRLTDQLVEQGYIQKERTVKSDARVAVLTLTAQGKKQRSAVLAARRKTLEKLLKPLNGKELKLLGQLAEKILLAGVSSSIEAERVCRFCDTPAIQAS